MTIKDDITLVREYIMFYTEKGHEMRDAFNRIEAALTPPADRQAALDAFEKYIESIHPDGSVLIDGWIEAEDVAKIRAALSSPAVPVIDWLDRVNEVELIDELSSEEQAAALKAAYAYLQLSKKNVVE